MNLLAPFLKLLLLLVSTPSNSSGLYGLIGQCVVESFIFLVKAYAI